MLAAAFVTVGTTCDEVPTRLTAQQELEFPVQSTEQRLLVRVRPGSGQVVELTIPPGFSLEVDPVVAVFDAGVPPIEVDLENDTGTPGARVSCNIEECDLRVVVQRSASSTEDVARVDVSVLVGGCSASPAAELELTRE